MDIVNVVKEMFNIKININHKKIAESKNHTYIGTYEKNEIMMDSNKILNTSQRQFMRVYCNYCNRYYDVRVDIFSKKKEYSGCKQCCGKIENSFYYSHPNIVIFDDDGNEIDTRFIHNNTVKQYYVKCDKCGLLSSSKKHIRDFSCEYCSDGLPITEKFMTNVLNQLNIEFKTQLNKSDFDWCSYFYYDFYLPKYNIIIETHGLQHYKDRSSNSNWGKLGEIKMNDLFKYKCAKNHIDNYITIDCRYSELNWLKENIIKELNDYFNLSNIDWELAWEESQNSKCVETWKLWNSGIQDISFISDLLNICRDTVTKYIKIGVKCNKICNYDPEKQKRKCLTSTRKHIIRLNDCKIFKSIQEASELYNIDNSSISACCKGKRKSAGKFNGEKAIWRYLVWNHNKIYRII